MKKLVEKISKMKPIIKSKELKFEQESLKLESIRSQRKEVFTNLKKSEKSYISGVELINAKKSEDIASTEVFSQSLDYAKAIWHKNLKELQKVEDRERKQIEAVIDAQKDLKSAEMLQDKFEEDLRILQAKHEQKSLDDISVTSHRKGRSQI